MTSALSIDRGEDIREERDNKKEVKGAGGLLDERGENDNSRFGMAPVDYQINDRKLSDDDLWHCYVAYIVFDLIKKNTSWIILSTFTPKENGIKKIRK